MKIGELVQLLSGGPIMTVQKFERNPMNEGNEIFNQVYCQWFDVNNELKEAKFNTESLKNIENEK